MIIIPKKDIKQTGRMVLIYSETGGGKTVSTIQSAPDPILYIQTEPRSLKPSLDAANRPDVDLDVAEYTNFTDLMAFLAKQDNFTRYKTVVLDSLTHLAAICLSSEIEDEAFDARSVEEQRKKPLVNRTKLSMEGYGGLSSNLFRLTNLFGKLSLDGKIVIFTCLLDERPKWDRALAAAPALKGREYPNSMPGFFDLIGKLEDRVKDGQVVYPPIVRFHSPDGDFTAKFTGNGKNAGPLDFGKILNGAKQ